MEFTIYSVGSAAYLEDILNAVAMISGAGKIEDLAKIGLLIGVLILGFQAVFNNTGIQFQKVGVCLILYLACFGPQTTVLIEDIYTGERSNQPDSRKEGGPDRDDHHVCPA